MRDIVMLVFGGEPREACEHDERMCGGHPAPAGDWCQTSPGDDALRWMGVTRGSRERKRDRSGRAPFGMRIF
jgi:hypothetical protein